MGKIFRVGRVVVRVLSILMVIVLLLLALINLPFVQDRITDYAESYLSERTNTPISVEKISINFLGHILVRELWIPDQQQDTLLHLGKLEVGFQLRELFRKRIQIKSVELDDVQVNVHPERDTVMNYQFLIDAFGGSSAEESGPEFSPAPDDGEATGGWEVVLSNARLGFHQVRVNYLQPDSTMVVNSRIGSLELSTELAEVMAGRIGLDRLALENSDIYLKMMADTTEAPPDTTSGTFDLRLDAGQLAITDVRYRMDLEDLAIESHVGSAVAADNHLLLLGDSLRIDIARFDLADSHYRMDTPSAPPATGLDYSHLNFDNIEIRISDFLYDNLDISGEVRQLAGKDLSGFELSSLQTRIHYTVDSIELWTLHAVTPQTRINAEHGKLTFPFLEDSTLFEEMLVDLQIDSTILHPVDIRYFVPVLDEQGFFRQHHTQPVHLSARLRGTLADLAIESFDLRAWDARANLSGRLKHLTDMDKLETDLLIAAIESTGHGISKWLPAGTLPANIELPDDVLLRGRVSGPLARLDLDLEATANRPTQTVAARLQLNGQLRNVLDPDHLAYELALDTLWVSSQEMKAYLPDSFPAYIELPEAIALAGKFQGNMDSVYADVQLEAFRDNMISNIRVAGTIDSFTNADALAFDLKLSELKIQPGELAAYLPDSTLPSYLLLPRIEHGEGVFRSDKANIDARFEIVTPEAALDGDVKLKDSAFVVNIELENLHLQGFFADSIAFDSVVGWPAPPMALQLTAEGHGLDIDRNLKSTTALRLRMLGDTIDWYDGLVIKGQVDRKSFQGTIRAKERQLDLDLSLLADFNSGMDTAMVKGQLNNVDLYGLKFFKVPFQVKAGLDMTSRGRSLDSLFLDFTASDFSVTYDSITESTKQLQARFKRIEKQNILAFIIQSDFASVIGLDQATDAQFFENGLGELLANLDAERSQLQLNPDSTKNLYLSLVVREPEIFTSGIIPGLTELDPILIQGALDMQDSSFAVFANIPHIKYQSFAVDSIEVKSVNWDELFYAQLTMQEAQLFDQIAVRDLNVSGLKRPGSDTLLFLLRQKDSLLAPDPEQAMRFQVVALVHPERGNYHISFGPQQILNFDTSWSFDQRNEIVYGKEGLHVKNLRLFKDKHSLTINELANNRIQADFDNFDLSFFGNIIKWNSDYVMGDANGQVVVQDILDSLKLNSELKVANFGVLATPLGDLDVKVGNESGGVWNGEVALRGQGNDVVLNGSYKPAKLAAEIRGQLHARPLNLGSLKQLAKAYVSDLDGILNADLAISGNLKKPIVKGQAEFQKATFRPIVTASRLEIPSGVIVFRENAISSPQEIVVLDSLGHRALLNLGIMLGDFPQMSFASQIKAENFLVLNTPAQDSALYYGTIYADIDVNLVGNTQELININCMLTPREGSSLVYVYDQGNEIEKVESGDGLVRFVDFETMGDRETEPENTKPVNSGGYNLDISAALNKNLDLAVIISREAGDRLDGKAEGNLVLHYPSQGNMELTGQLDVSGSKYLFTYEKVIRKEFELQEGSTVTFVGPVSNPNLNLLAGYFAKTSPDLLVTTYGGIDPNSDVDITRLKRRQEFQVKVKAEGTLEEANLSTDIQYTKTPGNNSADLVDPALTKLRSDPSEMNAQAFSLVIFNSFRLSGAGGGGKSLINLKQEVGNIVSNQLNKLADQFVNFVELDFGIETLNDGSNDLNFEGTDFRIGIKKRFFKDRLVAEVDGVASIGSSGSSSGENMQSFLDKISLEYALNPKGGFRLRAFNEFDRNDVVGGSAMKIGGALLISKNFNRLLFKKNFRRPVVSSDPENNPDSSKMMFLTEPDSTKHER